MHLITSWLLLTALTLTNAIPSSSSNPNSQSRNPISEYDDSFACTSEGFFPHPTDCLKFIRCVSDSDGSLERNDFDCAAGTDLWCQSLLTCSFEFQCPEGCSSDSDSSSAAHNELSDQEVLTDGDHAEAPLRSEHHDALRH